jgi:hypothetical protein
VEVNQSVRFSVTVRKDLRSVLERAAGEEGRSLGNMANQLIHEGLERLKCQYANHNHEVRHESANSQAH